MHCRRADRACRAHPAAIRPLRPTHGRISLQRALDLSPSFDTCGWFAREVGTVARAADVLLGDDATPLPQTVRLLLTTEVWGELAPEVSAALAARPFVRPLR